MSEHREAARRRFDGRATRYERERRSRRDVRPQDDGLEALPLAPADRFLDVRCGSGAAVRAAALARPAVGLDLSPRRVERLVAAAGLEALEQRPPAARGSALLCARRPAARAGR